MAKTTKKKTKPTTYTSKFTNRKTGKSTTRRMSCKVAAKKCGLTTNYTVVRSVKGSQAYPIAGFLKPKRGYFCVYFLPSMQRMFHTSQLTKAALYIGRMEDKLTAEQAAGLLVVTTSGTDENFKMQLTAMVEPAMAAGGKRTKLVPQP